MAKKPRSLGLGTLAVLKAVCDGPAYGLEIMAATGQPSGTVYPALGRLEERGFVTTHWESNATARKEARPRRRYYRITAAGSKELVAALTRWSALNAPAPAPFTPRHV